MSYLYSAGRGVLSGSQASPGGCRGYQYYPIPLLAPALTKPAAPRPAWPTLRLSDGALRFPAKIRQCASVCEGFTLDQWSAQLRLGVLWGSCGTECMSWKGCCLYFSEPRVSIWMKELSRCCRLGLHNQSEAQTSTSKVLGECPVKVPFFCNKTGAIKQYSWVSWLWQLWGDRASVSQIKFAKVSHVISSITHRPSITHTGIVRI